MQLDRLGFRVTGLHMTQAKMGRAQTKAAGTRIRFLAADAEATMERTARYDAVVARHLV